LVMFFPDFFIFVFLVSHRWTLFRSAVVND